MSSREELQLFTEPVTGIHSDDTVLEFHECPLCGRVANVRYSEHKNVVSESGDIVVHGKLGCKMCSLYIEDKTAPNPHQRDLSFVRKRMAQEWNRLTFHKKGITTEFMSPWRSIFDYRRD